MQVLPHLDEQRVVESINRIGGSLRAFGRDRKQLKWAIIWAVANWGLDAACLYALSDFAQQHAETLAEIDLNPIKALPTGCVVVDALIVAGAKE